MPCYQPLEGWVSRYPGKNGGFGIVFKKENSFGVSMQVPCGQCIGCRIKRSRDWAIRCTHEAQYQAEKGKPSCFITLTYNPDNLPAYGSLVKPDYQKFMKRLRKKFPDEKISYYMCGEYGHKLGRPHYHACLFGFCFTDLQLWKLSGKEKLYRSPTLEKLWTKGYSSVGAFTWNTAAYVARYVLKKRWGESAHQHYMTCDEYTGELNSIEPEYTAMSTKPAIGKKWFEKYGGDVFPHDHVIHKGRRDTPPRYYEILYERDDPAGHEKIKKNRRKKAIAAREDNTPQRLDERAEVQKIRAKRLVRVYEENQ